MQSLNLRLPAALGGEEFVLVLPNTRLEEALRTAEQFREA